MSTFSAAMAEHMAERAAAEARRTAQLDAAVAELGTQSQRVRWDEDLLDEDEVLALIEARAYAPLDAVAQQYQKLVAADLSGHSDDCTMGDAPTVTWQVYEEDITLSEGEYTRLVAIRAAVTERQATLTLRRHVGTCDVDDCDARATLVGVRVRLTVGELTFSREYGLSS